VVLEGLVKLSEENIKMPNADCVPYEILKKKSTL